MNNGKIHACFFEFLQLFDIRSSPDGGQIAVGIRSDIWSFDVARDVMSRLTFEVASFENLRPVWSPDGTEIAFTGSGGVYRTSTGGTSEADRITNTRLSFPIATSWSPDGNTIILQTLRTETGRDLRILRVEDGTLSTFVETPFNERAAMFSPDGRFVAYESNESGRYEVFVVPFPEPNRKWQISTDGGQQPRWSRSGDELFYRSGNAMMSVSVQTQDDFIPLKPSLLFEAPFATGDRFDDYDNPSITARHDRSSSGVDQAAASVPDGPVFARDLYALCMLGAEGVGKKARAYVASSLRASVIHPPPSTMSPS